MNVPKCTASPEDLANPGAAVWRKATGERIALIGTPLALQPSPFIVNTWRNRPVGRIAAVEFSALHTDEVLALRLVWAAPHPTAAIDDNDRFPDGAAVIFPVRGDAPLATMGSPEQPVDAWHWRADRPGKARSNVATGLGTTRVNRTMDIAANAEHRDGHWRVVFVRRLISNAPDASANAASAVQFIAGRPARIAFAVWDGGNGERGGLKAFSPDWRDITLT